MKTKSPALLCALAISFAAATPAYAMSDGSPEAVAADVFVARPACLAATVVGSAVFVLALPFAALSKTVKKTAHTLVVKPAKATFTRDVGDLSDLMD